MGQELIIPRKIAGNTNTALKLDLGIYGNTFDNMGVIEKGGPAHSHTTS